MEDDHPLAALIADALSQQGQVVDVALSVYRPDAIVLDLLLSALDGWAFIEQYRAATGGRLIPIMVVSAAGLRHALCWRCWASGTPSPSPARSTKVARAVAEVVRTHPAGG